MKQIKFFSASRIAITAVFAALSGILYLIRIPLSFAFPSFLEMNFSDVPALIGTFALGPVSGSLIVLVKILIKLLIHGTSTAFIGELADLIMGLGFVIPAGIIYKKNRTVKGAVIALAAGGLSSTACSLLANRFILIPFFANLMGMDALVGVMSSLFPNCTADTFYSYYIWCSALPFNLLRCVIAALITFPVYKRISNVIKKLNQKYEGCGDSVCTEEKVKAKNKNTIIAICIFAVALVVMLTVVLVRYFLQ